MEEKEWGRRGGVRVLKTASANVLQQNNFSFYSCFFSPSLPSLLFFLLLSSLLLAISATLGKERDRGRARGKKSLKTIIIKKNSHPMNRRKRALAGAGSMFLWGRRKVDTEADSGGFSVQRHLLHRRWRRRKRKVAWRRRFVSAFYAKSPGLKGAFST